MRRKSRHTGNLVSPRLPDRTSSLVRDPLSPSARSVRGAMVPRWGYGSGVFSGPDLSHVEPLESVRHGCITEEEEPPVVEFAQEVLCTVDGLGHGFDVLDESRARVRWAV